MSNSKKTREGPFSRLPPNLASLVLYRRLGARHRRTRPPRDHSYEVWLRNHGHGDDVLRTQPHAASDPQKLLWRWTRRFLLKRRRTSGADRPGTTDPTLEVWRLHHSGGTAPLLRPPVSHDIPPTRSGPRQRRVFSHELSEVGPGRASTTLFLERPYPALAGDAAPETVGTTAPEPRFPARHRVSGGLRLIRFIFRSIRRLIRPSRPTLPMPTPSSEPGAETEPLDTEVEKVLAALLKEGGKDLKHGGELRRSIRRLLELDGDSGRDQELEAKDAQIQLLEGKIRRLAALLEENERERERMRLGRSQATSKPQGAPKTDARAKADDPNRKAMLGMMLQIREMNRQIRADIRNLSAPAATQDDGNNQPTVTAADSPGGVTHPRQSAEPSGTSGE